MKVLLALVMSAALAPAAYAHPARDLTEPASAAPSCSRTAASTPPAT